MFRTVPLSTISFSLYKQHWSTVYVLQQGQDGVPSWSCSQAVSKRLWHIPLLCVQWKAPDGGQRNCPKHVANLYDIYHCCVYTKKTPDDGQRNCPRHVEFYSKNKFGKLVHLVGFVISIYHDARSSERHINRKYWMSHYNANMVRKYPAIIRSLF